MTKFDFSVLAIPFTEIESFVIHFLVVNLSFLQIYR